MRIRRRVEVSPGHPTRLEISKMKLRIWLWIDVECGRRAGGHVGAVQRRGRVEPPRVRPPYPDPGTLKPRTENLKPYTPTLGGTTKSSLPHNPDFATPKPGTGNPQPYTP